MKYATSLAALIVSVALVVLLTLAVRADSPSVEQWGLYEITLSGPIKGNPFRDVRFGARFSRDGADVEALGFYDGHGIYRVRFMPEAPGRWHYTTFSNEKELDGQRGSFTVKEPSPGNHGPVHVTNTFHFAYADGTPFKPIGTTCYVWTLQDDEQEEQTLKTLAASPFNKIRFLVFPKRYEYVTNEPRIYPFEGKPPKTWDFTRFNPAYFQHLEKRVADLQKLGIEADIILFHPYDKGAWGCDRMPSAVDDAYLHYIVSRLAAYRNVWWSIANEFDLMKNKTEADWDRFFQIVQADDPYHHLRSIHNCRLIYNHNLPWVTHASIQNGSAVEDCARAVIYRDVYRKPIVFDEVKYEGNIPQRWGHLSGEEMVLRFWEGTIAGSYVGHSETIKDGDMDNLWWSRGGTLRGQSAPRIAFLKQVLDDGPREGLEPIDKWQNRRCAGQEGKYYLIYFGRTPPGTWTVELPKFGLEDGVEFKAEILDTWNMTVTPVEGTFKMEKKDNYIFVDTQGRSITLPNKPYLALRLKRH